MDFIYGARTLEGTDLDPLRCWRADRSSRPGKRSWSTFSVRLWQGPRRVALPRSGTRPRHSLTKDDNKKNKCMRSSLVWLKRLTANDEVVATVLGPIPASSDTVESEGRQMTQCWILYIKKSKIIHLIKKINILGPECTDLNDRWL
jgi:hypothetical protein